MILIKSHVRPVFMQVLVCLWNDRTVHTRETWTSWIRSGSLEPRWPIPVTVEPAVYICLETGNSIESFRSEVDAAGVVCTESLDLSRSLQLTIILLCVCRGYRVDWYQRRWLQITTRLQFCGSAILHTSGKSQISFFLLNLLRAQIRRLSLLSMPFLLSQVAQ